jgi:hypothetical protein
MSISYHVRATVTRQKTRNGENGSASFTSEEIDLEADGISLVEFGAGGVEPYKRFLSRSPPV